MSFSVNPIGTVHTDDNGYSIEILPTYAVALAGLSGFGHVQVIWWFDGCDNAGSRGKLTEHKPYKKGPELLGTFATRSPGRPNPIAVFTPSVTYVDEKAGVLGLAWIDANDGTPVLDIKPYTPIADRVEHPIVPAWCAHWPRNIEESGDFDWSVEFNF